MGIDHARFERAKAGVLSPGGGGIGTLGEKTLHAVLKDYYCVQGAQKEVKIDRHVVDLWDGQTVTEIQTRNFDRLRGKLTSLLPDYPVRVIYPLARVKWLLWIDEENGAVSDKRRSPRRGTALSAFGELYKIRAHLTHPNLRVTIALLDLEEYRSLNGWGADRKRGSSRFDRIPLALCEEVDICSPRDWQSLVPDSLPTQFTSLDFKACAHIRREQAQTALNVLYSVGALTRVGKRGSFILYERGGA